MQIEIKVESDCKETKILIITDKITEEIQKLMKNLSGETPQILSGFNSDKLEIIDQNDIIRIYASNSKVYAVTEGGELTLRLRLYELEERLDDKIFIRISNSELINIKKIREFDLSFSGTICVILKDGTATYVSRRYVSKIKKTLGI